MQDAQNKPGKRGTPINLYRRRRTRVRPLGPACYVDIQTEIVNGKVRIRVFGPDGVEIEHFKVEEAGAR